MMYLKSESEFKNYAVNNLNISAAQFECWENAKRTQGVPQVTSGGSQVTSGRLQSPNSSLTPYILEERQMQVTQMDIFSRLMQDRIIYLQGVVDETMSSIFSSQLLFLQNLDPDSDITVYLDSPGGSVKAGLTMVDTMNFVKPDIAVINMGMAASMGSVLLSNGTKGKRSSLKHSRTMLHQVSFGFSGNIQSARIDVNEAEKYNDILFDIISKNTNKSKDELLVLTNRDLWLDSDESLELGIIDSIF